MKNWNFDKFLEKQLKDPEFAKAFYIAIGEITTVDNIVNYLQDIQDTDPIIEIQWVIDEIKQRKWDSKGESNE